VSRLLVSSSPVRSVLMADVERRSPLRHRGQDADSRRRHRGLADETPATRRDPVPASKVKVQNPGFVRVIAWSEKVTSTPNIERIDYLAFQPPKP